MIVWGFTNATTSWADTATSVVDTQANAYTKIFDARVPYLNGAALACYICTNCKSGANTPTYQFAVGASGWCMGIIVSEYSGLAGASIGNYANASIFAGPGNTPYSVTLTDSFGVTITDTFFGSSGSPSPSGGIGTSSGLGIINLVIGTTNIRIAAAATSGAHMTGITDSGGITFTKQFQSSGNLGTGPNAVAGPIELWDGSPYTLAQVQPASFATLV